MLPDRKRIIQAVHRYFIEHSLTLSVAESCTGGLIMHLVTITPGASRYFIGGVVAYSADIKRSLLGVHPDTIQTHGVVSQETALAMASGVRGIMKADIGISTTGNLGPEVLEGKEVGLVCFGYSSQGREATRVFRFKGTREEIKESAALYALQQLLDFLEE